MMSGTASDPISAYFEQQHALCNNPKKLDSKLS